MSGVNGVSEQVKGNDISVEWVVWGCGKRVTAGSWAVWVLSPALWLWFPCVTRREGDREWSCQEQGSLPGSPLASVHLCPPPPAQRLSLPMSAALRCPPPPLPLHFFLPHPLPKSDYNFLKGRNRSQILAYSSVLQWNLAHNRYHWVSNEWTNENKTKKWLMTFWWRGFKKCIRNYLRHTEKA